MSKDDYKILIELHNYNRISGCKSIKFLVFISSIKYQVSNTSVNLSDLKFNYQVLNFFNIYIYSFLRVTFMRSYRADCIVYIYTQYLQYY